MPNLHDILRLPPLHGSFLPHLSLYDFRTLSLLNSQFNATIRADGPRFRRLLGAACEELLFNPVGLPLPCGNRLLQMRNCVDNNDDDSENARRRRHGLGAKNVCVACRDRDAQLRGRLWDGTLPHRVWHCRRCSRRYRRRYAPGQNNCLCRASTSDTATCPWKCSNCATADIHKLITTGTERENDLLTTHRKKDRKSGRTTRVKTGARRKRPACPGCIGQPWLARQGGTWIPHPQSTQMCTRCEGVIL